MIDTDKITTAITLGVSIGVLEGLVEMLRRPGSPQMHNNEEFAGFIDMMLDEYKQRRDA